MQYNRFQQGKTSSLTKELIETLNNMGFVWETIEYPPHMMMGAKHAQPVMSMMRGTEYNSQPVLFSPSAAQQQPFAQSDNMMHYRPSAAAAAASNASLVSGASMALMNMIPMAPPQMNNALCVLVPIHRLQMFAPPRDPRLAAQVALSYNLLNQMHGNWA